MSQDEIRIGVSTCLLGDEVRFDGGHKRDRYLTDVLSKFVSFVPVCPEVESGMSTPREPIRLVERQGAVHLVGTKTATDHTTSMRRFSKLRARALVRDDLSGYILKKDSPSCGMTRVRLYSSAAQPRRVGVGLFAEALMAAMPDLPVEEEGRLNDPPLRENFLERVFAYRRVRSLFAGRWSRGDLVRFHTAEKLLLMAHDPPTYRELGRLVATVGEHARRDVVRTYQAQFMSGLTKIATVRKNVNVLQHIQGYFKRLSTDGDRRELEGVIEDYRQGLVPLVVPATLITHFVRVYDVEYLRGQTYLAPHPKELMLRNHA